LIVKVNYRGYELSAHREKCMAGYPLLYYSIFRQSDGYEATSGFEDSAETIPDKIAQLRERVDNELAEDDPWMERENGPLQP
jgi:hypothetical protein